MITRIGVFVVLVGLAVAVILIIWRNAVQFEIPFYADIHSQRPLLCPVKPIVIVAFGQSSAANSGKHVYEQRSKENLYMYFDGLCFDLADPLLEATNKGGSIWIPVASRVARLTGKPVVIIGGGVDGSTIAQWTAKRFRFATPLRARIREARRSGLSPDIFVWIQGNSGAESKIS